MKFFSKNHKKCHIWEPKNIWAVIFGGKIGNSWEYRDRASLER